MTTEMIVAESRELHQLTTQMQRHVDRTLEADRKGGEALWEKALAVADARAEAKHGDWQAYLGATGMEERSARRLIGIADRGRSEGRFREAIISGWLSFSVAAIAAKADDDLLTGLLDQPTPPTRAQLMASANPAPVPDLKPAQRITIAPTNPLDSVAEALRKNDTKAAYAVVHLISNDDERKRAYAAVDARIDGKSLDTVLSMLQPTPTTPTTPALSAFPPSHVEAGIGAIERRLAAGIPQTTDLAFATQLRTQLYAAREGMEPAIYESWAARLDAVQAALEKLKTQQMKPNRCAHCGISWSIIIGKLCESCYSLAEAQKWESGSEDMRWRLKNALTAAWAMTDETIRASRIIEIKQVAATHKIDLDAPIIEAPMAMPVAKTTPAKATKPRELLRQHVEYVLAGLIERITPAELRLLHALIVSFPPSDDISADVWKEGRDILDLPSTDLEWVMDTVKSIPG